MIVNCVKWSVSLRAKHIPVTCQEGIRSTKKIRMLILTEAEAEVDQKTSQIAANVV